MEGFLACPCGSGERYRFCCRRRDRERHEARHLAWRHGIDPAQEVLMQAFAEGRNLEPGLRNPAGRSLLRATQSPRLHPEWIDLDGPALPLKPFVHDGRPWRACDFDLRVTGGETVERRRAEVRRAVEALAERFRGHLHHRFQIGLREARRYASWIVAYAGEFLLPFWNISPLHVRPWESPARAFLGNFVIRRYENCGMDDLIEGLHSLSAFYAFACRLGLAPRFLAEPVIDSCREWPFFEKRLADYLALAGGDGWIEWTMQYDYEQVPPPPHSHLEEEYERRMSEYHRAG